MQQEEKPTIPEFPCLNCDRPIDGLVQGQPPLFCSRQCQKDAEFVRYSRKIIRSSSLSKAMILKASKYWFGYIAGIAELSEEDMEGYLEGLFERIESATPLRACDDEKKWFQSTMQKILSQRIKQYPVIDGVIPGKNGLVKTGPTLKEKGVVKWFLNEEGYGVIKRQKGGEIGVHYTDIDKKGFKTLEKGQQVTFNVNNGIKGLQAVGVRVVS